MSRMRTLMGDMRIHRNRGDWDEGLPLHQAFSCGSGMTDLMALVMSDDELPAKVTLPVQASSAQWLPWIGVTTGLTPV